MHIDCGSSERNLLLENMSFGSSHVGAFHLLLFTEEPEISVHYNLLRTDLLSVIQKLWFIINPLVLEMDI